MIRKVFLYLFDVVVVSIVISLGVLSIFLYKLNNELPSINELKDFTYKEPTIIYDKNENIIAELGEEVRYPVDLEDIPLYLKEAIIAVEDSRFYEHGGVDLFSIIRAFIVNIKAGKIVEGGSTLTQQLVKVLYLTPEKKLKRKVKEAMLAYKIDNYLSKDKILEMYLNQVYLGRGAYGVSAAARNYFNKRLYELTLEECALIAGLPKAPGIYAPHISYDKSLKRRDHVLLRMFEEGFITELTYKTMVIKPIIFEDKKPIRLRYAGHFVDYVIDYLHNTLEIKDVTNSGYKIYTSLDLAFQQLAEEKVKNNLFLITRRIGYSGPIGNANDHNIETKLKNVKYLSDLDMLVAEVIDVDRMEATLSLIDGIKTTLFLINNKWAKPYGSGKRNLDDLRTILRSGDYVLVKRNGKNNNVLELTQEPEVESALLAIDPTTGAILAMVGSFDFRKSMFNRATMAKRQAGSLFKPIVYAAAIEENYDLTSLIFDAPVIKKADLDNEYWKPENFEEKFYGFTTLKRALTKSRNVVTIKLAEKLGIRTIKHYSKKFGITSHLENDLSVSIGSSSIPLIEMVYAFSAFSNLGKIFAVNPLIRITDIKGDVIFKSSPVIKYNPISESTADIMNYALIDVVENGTGRKAKIIPRFIGGKTGSTNDYRDAWFVGYLPNLVVGVWAGFDDFRPIGRLETGARTVLPVWVNFVKDVLDKLDYATYPVSNNVVYYKVDPITHKKTENISVNYTFEPFSVGSK